MALNGIVLMLYVIDILYYKANDDSWGIGEVNSINHNKLIAYIVRFMMRAFI